MAYFLLKTIRTVTNYHMIEASTAAEAQAHVLSPRTRTKTASRFPSSGPKIRLSRTVESGESPLEPARAMTDEEVALAGLAPVVDSNRDDDEDDI
jgi:hypothetical protein